MYSSIWMIFAHYFACNVYDSYLLMQNRLGWWPCRHIGNSFVLAALYRELPVQATQVWLPHHLRHHIQRKFIFMLHDAGVHLMMMDRRAEIHWKILETTHIVSSLYLLLICIQILIEERIYILEIKESLIRHHETAGGRTRQENPSI